MHFEKFLTTPRGALQVREILATLGRYRGAREYILLAIWQQSRQQHQASQAKIIYKLKRQNLHENRVLCGEIFKTLKFLWFQVFPQNSGCSIKSLNLAQPTLRLALCRVAFERALGRFKRWPIVELRHLKIFPLSLQLLHCSFPSLPVFPRFLFLSLPHFYFPPLMSRGSCQRAASPQYLWHIFALLSLLQKTTKRIFDFFWIFFPPFLTQLRE